MKGYKVRAEILILCNVNNTSKLLMIGGKCVWKPAHAAIFTDEAIDHLQILKLSGTKQKHLQLRLSSTRFSIIFRVCGDHEPYLPCRAGLCCAPGQTPSLSQPFCLFMNSVLIMSLYGG